MADPPNQPDRPDRALHILALAGSFRTGSVNQALVAAAREEAPSHVAVDDLDLRAIPFYDGDLEAAGDPQEVAELKEAISGAGALLVVTPEYNGSLPAVLKNAMDWASRNHPNSVLRDKPVALMGATPGRGATSGAQAHARQILERIGAIVLDEPSVQLTLANEHMSDGVLVSAEIRSQVREVVDALVDAVDIDAACQSRAAMLTSYRAA